MNVLEVAWLLSYVESVDRFMSESDEAKAEQRAAGWATILEPVEAEWAMLQARRYYSTTPKDSLTPGWLADRWRAERRVEEARVPQSTHADRERLCVNADICACDHTVCMDGFLDEKKLVRVLHGRRYMGVVRCPACADAITMRAELSPSRSRKGRR